MTQIIGLVRRPKTDCCSLHDGCPDQLGHFSRAAGSCHCCTAESSRNMRKLSTSMPLEQGHSESPEAVWNQSCTDVGLRPMIRWNPPTASPRRWKRAIFGNSVQTYSTSLSCTCLACPKLWIYFQGLNSSICRSNNHSDLLETGLRFWYLHLLTSYRGHYPDFVTENARVPSFGLAE